jgi:hypothetical protein
VVTAVLSEVGAVTAPFAGKTASADVIKKVKTKILVLI